MEFPSPFLLGDNEIQNNSMLLRTQEPQFCKHFHMWLILNEHYLIGFQIIESEEILTEIQIYTGSDGNYDIWAGNQQATN